MKLVRALFSRTVFMLIMVCLEVYGIYYVFNWLGSNFAWLDTVLRIIGAIIVLGIIKSSKHLSNDLMWIILIMISPVVGTALFLLLGSNLLISRTFRDINFSTNNAKKYYVQNKNVMNELQELAPQDYGQFKYISDYSGFPFYKNTGLDYYDLGDKGYPAILEELKKAEKYIFLEYFIVEEGVMWNGILDILEQKAAEGLDVRVMYDDMGSFFTLSATYAEKLESKGIKCVSFNRIHPLIGTIMNHRDHRKILVIDGKVGFSGGINLADEYINVKKKYGHWKDNVIKIEGNAVWSLTVMFLTHWNALRKTDEDYNAFKYVSRKKKYDGYLAPYSDSPLDNEITAQNIYMDIVNQANDYVYIYTPYLIVDNEMLNCLILAAKRGVDVRIITPGIPDKKIVWNITRSFYPNLIDGGVKIFEYTPGFIHSKVFVSDDKVATVGTVNLDYRSLYLHFENGIYIYGSSKIADIKKDLTDSIEVSKQINIENIKANPIKDFFISVIRIFASLM